MKRIIACAAILAAAAACAPKEDSAAKPAEGAPATPAMAASSAPATPAALPDMEGPAAGQWEVTTESMGTAMKPIKVCYGKMTMSDMQKQQQSAGVTCSENKIDKTADGFNMHSVCKMDSTGMTTTTDGKVTGDMKSAYTMDMKMKMDPPPPGMGEMTMKISAKRLGDCEPGQTPITVPN